MTVKRIITGIMLIIFVISYGCKSTEQKSSEPNFKSIEKNASATGTLLNIKFTAGPTHSHALMAFWIEDISGQYIQTLFVARSIGNGVFEHGKAESGHWKPGEIQRPAALPVWAHKSHKEKNKFGYHLPTPENPVADTYTGATPLNSFILKTRTDKPLSGPTRIMMELNQPFDFNEYWTNTKHPDNKAYMTSGQPAIIYSTIINPAETDTVYSMKATGHAHYAGENGKIYKDLSTVTSARKIVRSVMVKVSSTKQ
ncbi:MAG: hypothetical protein K9H84_08490 [Bacteroidales bacterium]|nr:hypothetical protein [Bacteroidales bacterium]